MALVPVACAPYPIATAEAPLATAAGPTAMELLPVARESASVELAWKYLVPLAYKFDSASPTLLALTVEPSALVVV